MSQDRPALPDLLATVREFLEALGPTLAPGPRYQARVAAYLLEIAGRELERGPALDRAAALRLSAFLGESRDLPELERSLAARLRSGALDPRYQEALALLLAHAVDRVRVVKPAHLDPRHREDR